MSDTVEYDSFKTAMLEGIISIDAAIKSGLRNVLKVYIDKEKHDKRDRKITRFLSKLKQNDIDFQLCSRDYIDSIADGNTHGGVIALVSERKYADFNEFISSLGQNDYAVFLDGVEDPFNFGYSIRNLFAFGCKGFILPQRNWMSASNIVAKASAGASELCDMTVAPDDETALKILRDNKISVVCAGLSHDSVSLFDFIPPTPFVLFIGGEKRGISKLFYENADKIVHIPYSNEDASYSLPTASCAAIFGSFISKKRKL